MTKLMHDGLSEACRETARVVLSKKGNSSSDLVETLAEKYYEIAKSHQDFVRSELDSDVVIEHAVRYIAHVHASPIVGTDTDWFRDTLAALMELAVPNTGLSVEAGKFLPCLQEGVRASLAEIPMPRDSFRINDEETATIERLQNAGCEHGEVAGLLNLVELLFHGSPLTEEGARYFYLASVSAPLTRRARLSNRY